MKLYDLSDWPPVKYVHKAARILAVGAGMRNHFLVNPFEALEICLARAISGEDKDSLDRAVSKLTNQDNLSRDQMATIIRRELKRIYPFRFDNSSSGGPSFGGPCGNDPGIYGSGGKGGGAMGGDLLELELTPRREEPEEEIPIRIKWPIFLDQV